MGTLNLEDLETDILKMIIKVKLQAVRRAIIKIWVLMITSS